MGAWVKLKVGQAFPACRCFTLDLSSEETGQTRMSVLLQNSGEFFKVVNEATVFEATGFVVRGTEN